MRSESFALNAIAPHFFSKDIQALPLLPEHVHDIARRMPIRDALCLAMSCKTAKTVLHAEYALGRNAMQALHDAVDNSSIGMAVSAVVLLPKPWRPPLLNELAVKLRPYPNIPDRAGFDVWRSSLDPLNVWVMLEPDTVARALAFGQLLAARFRAARIHQVSISDQTLFPSPPVDKPFLRLQLDNIGMAYWPIALEPIIKATSWRAVRDILQRFVDRFDVVVPVISDELACGLAHVMSERWDGGKVRRILRERLGVCAQRQWIMIDASMADAIARTDSDELIELGCEGWRQGDKKFFWDVKHLRIRRRSNAIT